MRILSKIWWTPFLIYLLVITSFMNSEFDETVCKKIDARVTDSTMYRYVTAGDLYSLIIEGSLASPGTVISGRDLENIEQSVREIAEIKNAEAYMTIDGTLHVEANQRDPVLRIITSSNNSYYIDNQGYLFPHRNRYTPKLVTVTGNVEIPEGIASKGNISGLEDGSVIVSLVDLADLINGNQFWRNLVEQVWVTKDSELELIPRVGNILVRLGPPENLEYKLAVLEQFYKEKIPEAGWDAYSSISVKYKGQIICTKR